uniref:Fibronectin type-II domain-containing protein n=1 Tax=Bos taurus TaxID=9913 RepID=A0AAA9T425_BOVIN
IIKGHEKTVAHTEGSRSIHRDVCIHEANLIPQAASLASCRGFFSPGFQRLEEVWLWGQEREKRKVKKEEEVKAEKAEGKCFFPFRYRDGIFHDCVQFRVKHKWCSLNETYQGYWKYCSEEDFAKCVFPFWYRHLIYWGCTEDGDSFGKAWCSLTRNYNKDRVWKYCD